MKTISELNAKWWYRLLKVIFIILFLTSAIVAVSFVIAESEPYEITDMTKSTVTCLEGNQKTFTFTEVPNLFNDKVLSKSLISLCELDKSLEPTGTFITKMYENGFDRAKATLDVEREEQTVQNKVVYHVQSKIIGSVWDTLKLCLITVLSVVLFFELIRRIFYYIVLGSIRPKKNHESDTLLP